MVRIQVCWATEDIYVVGTFVVLSIVANVGIRIAHLGLTIHGSHMESQSLMFEGNIIGTVQKSFSGTDLSGNAPDASPFLIRTNLLQICNKCSPSKFTESILRPFQ